MSIFVNLNLITLFCSENIVVHTIFLSNLLYTITTKYIVLDFKIDMARRFRLKLLALFIHFLFIPSAELKPTIFIYCGPRYN